MSDYLENLAIRNTGVPGTEMLVQPRLPALYESAQPEAGQEVPLPYDMPWGQTSREPAPEAGHPRLQDSPDLGDRSTGGRQPSLGFLSDDRPLFPRPDRFRQPDGSFASTHAAVSAPFSGHEPVREPQAGESTHPSTGESDIAPVAAPLHIETAASVPDQPVRVSPAGPVPEQTETGARLPGSHLDRDDVLGSKDEAVEGSAVPMDSPLPERENPRRFAARASVKHRSQARPVETDDETIPPPASPRLGRAEAGGSSDVRATAAGKERRMVPQEIPSPVPGEMEAGGISETPPGPASTPVHQSDQNPVQARLQAQGPFPTFPPLPGHQRRGERAASPSEAEKSPVIRVSIGRVEVRAILPGAPAQKAGHRTPRLSLDDYLRQQNEEKR